MLLIRQELKVRVISFGATRLLEHHGGYVWYQKIAPSDQSLFKAFGVALDYANGIGFEAIEKREKELLDYVSNWEKIPKYISIFC